jgi:hypothetical protein
VSMIHNLSITPFSKRVQPPDCFTYQSTGSPIRTDTDRRLKTLPLPLGYTRKLF